VNFKVIAAVDLNYLMGYDNIIPWHKPADLKRFKQKTLNQIVVMGRKTYDSIGKALPNRTNCVISKNPGNIKNLSPGVIIFTSFQEMIEKLKDSNKTIWIIGGAQIYAEAFLTDLVSEIDLTILNGRWVPPNSDSEEIRKQKTILFPRIPLEYTIESEEVNIEDNSLLHRKYMRSYW